MKKISRYVLFLCAAVALTAAACTQGEPETPNERMGTLHLSLDLGETRADRYDALAHSTMRIYMLENGKEKLIRKYSPATEAPEELYLIGGEYRIAVEAGDLTPATFDRKSYAGELTTRITPHRTTREEIVCRITNIGVRVVFDKSLREKLEPGYTTCVCAADSFDPQAVEEGTVPSLVYTDDATGYFLLPEGTTDLSWSFSGTDATQNAIAASGTIKAPEGGNLYTLTYKYDRSLEGSLALTVLLAKEVSFSDAFLFSLPPTLRCEGFEFDQTLGYTPGEALSLAITSAQALTEVAVKIDDTTTIPVLAEGTLDPEAAKRGVVYTPASDKEGTLKLDAAFFDDLGGGIHGVELVATNKLKATANGNFRVVISGVSKQVATDLWNNTAEFRIYATSGTDGDFELRYRERTTGTSAFGSWKNLPADRSDEAYLYTARATDFAAGRDYEYQLVQNGAPQGPVLSLTTEAGVQLPNGDFETWSMFNNKTWFPCAEQEIGDNKGMGTQYLGFWGSGNPGSAAASRNITTPADDPRPGSSGTKCAYLNTQKIFGVIAAGNLFIGAFGGIHHVTKGDVYMGRPFTFNARPKAIRFWCKGNVGSGDKARLFVCMGVDWDSYHKIDTNDKSTFFDPTQETLPEGPICGHADWLQETLPGEWTEITLPIEYRSDAKPNYLMVTASASYRGDYMEGSENSEMYLDDIEFIY